MEYLCAWLSNTLEKFTATWSIFDLSPLSKNNANPLGVLSCDLFYPISPSHSLLFSLLRFSLLLLSAYTLFILLQDMTSLLVGRSWLCDPFFGGHTSILRVTMDTSNRPFLASSELQYLPLVSSLHRHMKWRLSTYAVCCILSPLSRHIWCITCSSSICFYCAWFFFEK